MKVLAIETSCDETSAAVVADGRDILSNVVSSQVDIHARYGGVVPEVASRQHILSIIPVVQKAIEDAQLDWSETDGVAVTFGPGLAGSLIVGVNAAKAIAAAHHLPLAGINHLEAHIYANWLSQAGPPVFPSLCLIVSGGHSDIILMEDHGRFTKLGGTRDDAAGEAFDKAARLLGLGYPGGPLIEKAALRGAPTLPLTRAWLKGTDDFSFSGLKTALYHLVQQSGLTASEQQVVDAAASFQKAVVEVLVTKTIQAALRLKVKQILVAGGVAANRALSNALKEQSPVPLLIPPPALCTDNAAMVAACGYYHLVRGQVDGLDIDVVPNLTLG